MPSSWSTRARFELQYTGENINLWGDKLNAVISLIDETINGVQLLVITGDRTLTTLNGVADEARRATLKLTGSPTMGFTITIPALEKAYNIWNTTAQIAVITTGSGATVSIRAGESVALICDAANVNRVQGTYFSNQRLTGVADPTSAQDAATKLYVDNTAWATGMGTLPGQTGNDGKYLQTNAGVPSWVAVTAAGIGAIGSAAPTITGGMTLSGGFAFTGATKQAVLPVAALNIDLSYTGAEYFTKSISANSTFTFSGYTATLGQAFALELTITSAAVPTWPASVQWGGGVAPTLGNGKHDLGFITFNGGTSWTGSVIAKAVA